MTIASTQNNPRHEFTATASQTTYTITFEFFAIDDLKVYVDGTLATYNVNPTTNVQYKVTATNSSSDSAYEFGTGATITSAQVILQDKK